MDFLNTAEKKDRRMIHLPMGRFGEAVELAKGALFCTYINVHHPVHQINVYLVQWRAMIAAILL